MGLWLFHSHIHVLTLVMQKLIWKKLGIDFDSSMKTGDKMKAIKLFIGLRLIQCCCTIKKEVCVTFVVPKVISKSSLDWRIIGATWCDTPCGTPWHDPAHLQHPQHSQELQAQIDIWSIVLEWPSWWVYFIHFLPFLYSLWLLAECLSTCPSKGSRLLVHCWCQAPQGMW